MNIRLNNWYEDIKNKDIIYPIISVPELPLSKNIIQINCESTFIQWLKELVNIYGDEGFIKLKYFENSDVEYSIIRIYNLKYIDDVFSR